MTRIGLLSAMKLELPRVIPYRKSQQVQTYRVGDCEIGVLVSGVGQKRAATATERLCTEFHPEYLLVLGVCGGVNPEVDIGTLLLADRVHYHDEYISVGGQQFDAVKQCLTDSAIDYRVGGMQTFNRTVLSKEHVLHDVLGVDMEAYAIVKKAKEHHIPPIIIKSVSDIVPGEKPVFLPSIRLLFRVLRHFSAAKRGLNEFAQNYFESQVP